LASDDVFILANGAVWVSDGDKAWREETVPADDVYVDGSLVGEIGERVMRDRERLSQDGFVVAYVPIDRRRRLAGETRLISRGFLHMDASAELMAAAQAELERGLRRNGRDHGQAVRKTLERFFYRRTGSRPVILPNIVHVQ
jgi:ribonuclease J